MRDDKTVMVVDDEEEILIAISKFLARNGIEAKCFDDPSDALKAMSENQFKIIITDIRMPKLYGYELIVELKKIGPLAAIIVITGYSNIDYVVRCIENGALDYFQKPLHDMSALLSTIRFCINRHKRWLGKDGLF